MYTQQYNDSSVYLFQHIDAVLPDTCSERSKDKKMIVDVMELAFVKITTIFANQDIK